MLILHNLDAILTISEIPFFHNMCPKSQLSDIFVPKMPTQHFLGFTICLSRMFFPVLSSQSYRLGISRFGDVSHDRFLRKKGCTVGRINIHTALDDLSLEFSVKFLPAKKLKKKFFFAVDEFAPFSILNRPHHIWSRECFLFLFFFYKSIK